MIGNQGHAARFRYVVPAGSDYNHSLHFPSGFLKEILNRDRRMHGVAPGTIATVPSDKPLIQQRIEDEDLVEALLYSRAPERIRYPNFICF